MRATNVRRGVEKGNASDSAERAGDKEAASGLPCGKKSLQERKGDCAQRADVTKVLGVPMEASLAEKLEKRG